jgi:NADH-quinone oxidoreductase subunit N
VKLADYYEPGITTTLQSVYTLVVPEAILVAAACVLFLGSTFRAGRNLWAGMALLAIGVASTIFAANPGATTDLVPTVSTIWPDGLTFFVRIVSLVSAVVLVFMTWGEVPERLAGEYYACLLLITAGVNLTAAANELITLFLALELVSIPTYVILYLAKNDRPAQESAVKYFLLSIFSSGLVLFGFSYLAGQTGTTNLPAIVDAYAGTGDGRLPVLALVAVVFVVAGLGFRITAVPFHFYAPDVYQGTSTGAAALLAVIPKIAGFAALIRVLGLVGPLSGEPALALDYHVALLLWILAAITMTLGNVIALWQDNLQRILAYSSIAHAGYMLVGLTTAPILFAQPSTAGGVPAVLFYLVAYGAMTFGVFGAISLLSSPSRRVETVDDLAGLSRTHPGAALVLSIFLFSLIGLPLTAGFVGKFMLLFGAVEVPQPLYWSLAVVMAVNAAIGAYYYLRIIGAMYLRGALRPLDQPRSLAGRIAIGMCVILTLVFGVYPNPLQRMAQAAVTHPDVKLVQR